LESSGKPRRLDQVANINLISTPTGNEALSVPDIWHFDQQSKHHMKSLQLHVKTAGALKRDKWRLQSPAAQHLCLVYPESLPCDWAG
jgi:hypothetical protein